MSTDYFLACKKHNIRIFIADGNGSSFNSDEWKPFYLNHVIKNCEIVFIDENDTGKYIRPYSDPNYKTVSRDGLPPSQDLYFVFIDKDLDNVHLSFFDGCDFLDDENKPLVGVTHWANTQEIRKRDEHGRKVYK